MPHTSAIFSSSRVVVIPTYQKHLELTRDFVLNGTVATIVPEHDFVVVVAVALHLPARRGAHAALGLVHRAVEVVVVPDFDGHDVVEGARTPHECFHADARLCAGRHQDGRGEDGLHDDGVEGSVWMVWMSIVVGGWILMELVGMSSVSMLKRPGLLYIVRLEVHAPYIAVSR
jgi:hypothetical protein